MGGEILAPILSLCFSHAFELGIFPSIFKIAKVVPIFESGNKQIVNNYRPISLLPTLSKILAKLIKTKLIELFDNYQVIYEFQYGFREKYSVIHALLDVNVFALDEFKANSKLPCYLWTFVKHLTLSLIILCFKNWIIMEFVALHISFVKVISRFETNLYPCKTTTPF